VLADWQLLDALARPLLIAQLNGRILHQSPALRRWLSCGPADVRRRVWHELEGVLAQLTGLWRSSADCECSIVVRREIRARRGSYSLRGVIVGQGAPQRGRPLILVELDRIRPRRLRLNELQSCFGFTLRQAQVAGLVAQGLSDREIADRLGIGLRTAEHHTAQVLRKLGVNSRSAAVALLLLPRGWPRYASRHGEAEEVPPTSGGVRADSGVPHRLTRGPPVPPSPGPRSMQRASRRQQSGHHSPPSGARSPSGSAPAGHPDPSPLRSSGPPPQAEVRRASRGALRKRPRGRRSLLR
jgi:DNA-binding CsgD family transcriptional regulator